MPATGSLSVTSVYSATSSAATAGTSTDAVTKTYNPNWQPGTIANQFDLAASYAGTLSASTTTHTLSAFPSASGTVAFARVRELYLKNTGATPLKVTPGGSQPWVAGFANDVLVRPGGLLLLAAPDLTGLAVASGSADKFTVVCTGSTTYELILKGASV